ncbi:MAG TPA: hypothetical protein PLJ21_09120, partial [Pseudobdellovibrionaceae bacterium]|nr:hypothetical protein [Pseudobdellovibrionaceae bacterium]
EAILATSQEFWIAQTEKHTPDSYFVDQVLQDPKLQKEFLDFVKSRKQLLEPSESKNRDLSI